MSLHILDEPVLTVSLFLHDKPERVFSDNDTITSRRLRVYAANLHARLIYLADILAKLEADGWDAQSVGYDVRLSHSDVATARAARRRIKAIGLNTKDFCILED